MVEPEELSLREHVAFQLTPPAPAERHVVVVVDDEPQILEALRRTLEGEPYELRLTGDPGTALGWVERDPVSLILTDQVMPEVSGADLLEKVKECSPLTTRALLTGHPGAPLDYGLTHGVKYLIGKPWNDEALRAVIRQMLHDREEAGPAPPAPAVRRSPRRRRPAPEILAEIEAHFGRIPGLFAPALEDPAVLERLWARTVTACLENPIPEFFRERLFAYLSRYSTASYLLILHGARLEALGMPASEILRLLEEPLRSLEGDAERARAGLDGKRVSGDDWPAAGSEPERLLFCSSVALYLKTASAKRCRTALHRSLGPELHGRLLGFLSYVRLCQRWVEGHPSITADSEPGLAARRDRLAKAEPRLGEFFASHRDRVAREFRERVQGLLEGPSQVEREGSFVLRLTNKELVREVAERKRVEEELRQTNEILENAVEGILRVDPSGRIVSVNRAGAALLGCAPEERTGTEWARIVHPEDRERVVQAYVRMMARGKSWCEVRAVRQDGSLLPVEIVSLKATDRAGNCGGHYAFIKDISERHRAQEERDRMSAQLLQGQKMQALGQLAAGIAHEINNPTSFILSNLSTLGRYREDLARLLRAALEGGEHGPSQEYLRAREEVDVEALQTDFKAALDESRQGAERIRDIVRSLKEFSHPDEGEARPVDINGCLEDALKICWNELKYKVEVEREYGPLSPIAGFPQRLEQAFVNLLVNAAQAIEGRGKVTVSTREEAGVLRICIRDTGCGIPPENMKLIFTPFFTTKPVGTGTGLGLHVVYKVVTAHGGTIEVQSEPGRGTEVTVRLPLTGAEGGKP